MRRSSHPCAGNPQANKTLLFRKFWAYQPQALPHPTAEPAGVDRRVWVCPLPEFCGKGSWQWVGHTCWGSRPEAAVSPCMRESKQDVPVGGRIVGRPTGELLAGLKLPHAVDSMLWSSSMVTFKRLFSGSAADIDWACRFNTCGRANSGIHSAVPGDIPSATLG